jgi:dihydroorotase-like cyclic amidohydrolase
MMVNLVIKNGYVVTPTGIVYGGVGVEEEKIIYLGSNYGLPKGKRVIDAKEGFVLPGLIDPHVHMGAEYGVPFKEEYETSFKQSETEGTARRSDYFWTYVSIVPQESNLECLEALIGAGNELSYIDFFFNSAITSEVHLKEQPELWRRGVTSFKHFFNAYKGPEGLGLLSDTDESIVYQSLLFVVERGYPGIALFHCEEMDPIYILAKRLQIEGRNDLKAWTEARPAWVEVKRMRRP